jgi:hypothetical protein
MEPTRPDCGRPLVAKTNGTLKSPHGPPAKAMMFPSLQKPQRSPQRAVKRVDLNYMVADPTTNEGGLEKGLR